jgi:DNA topoisomerase-1
LFDISSSGRTAFAAFIEAFFPHDIMRRRADERQGSGQEAVAAPTRPCGGGARRWLWGTKAHWPDCRRGTTIGRIMPVQEDTNAAEHPAHLTPPRRGAPNGQSRSPATMKLLRRLGLTYVATEELTIRRLRHGRGFRYVAADGTPLRGEESQRLAALAVPPAYVDVLYAADPRAHIQAIGRDAAGRLQYRYHPDWQRVREMRKARRLARLAEVLPQIRRCIARHLGASEPTRAFTLAAVIDLVARSAIRPGSEQYARLRGTRGATVRLCFRAKGGKRVEKEVHAPRLAAAVAVLRRLPGRRLFQYRSEDGALRQASAHDVNRFLREIAGVEISLKDFRTLLASVAVLDALACAAPATGKRARRRQVLDAIRQAADDLGNTPAICAKSYVHETVVNAFEDGVLEQFAERLRSSRSNSRSEKVLAQIAAQVRAGAAA